MSDLEQDFLSAREQLPAARGPSTFGEVWSANWSATGLETLTGVGKPAEDAYSDLVKAVEGRIGMPVHEALRDRGVGLGTANTREQRVAMIGGLVAELPEADRKAIEPLLDVRKRAATKAADIERDAGDINDSAYGVSANAVRFAAGIARQAVDPVNIATLPLGGPLKGPVIPMLGREFVYGAAAQAIQTPRIQIGRAELDLESGFARGAGDVFEAGLGNAGFAGLLRGGAAVIRAARGAARGRPESAPVRADDASPAPENAPTDSATGPAGPIIEHRPEVARTFADVAPEDLEAVARVVERDTALDAQIPNATEADHARIAAGVEEAKAALEAGRPFDVRAEAAGNPISLAGLSDETPVRIQFMANRTGSGGANDFGAQAEIVPLNAATFERYMVGPRRTAGQDVPAMYASLEAYLKEVERPENLGHRPDVIVLDGGGRLQQVGSRADIEQYFNSDTRAGWRRQVPSFDSAEAKAFGALDDEAVYGAKVPPAASPPALSDLPLPAALPVAGRDVARGMSIERVGEVDGEGIIGFDAIEGHVRLVDGSEHAVSNGGGTIWGKDGSMIHPSVVAAFRNSQYGPEASWVAVKRPSPAQSAKPPAAGDAAPKPLGDPALARDADRVLEEIGDLEIVLENPDGSFRKVSARVALREADDYAAAARELADCIGGTP